LEIQKHSRLGIASFVFGITSTIFFLVLLCSFLLFAMEDVALKAARGREGFLALFAMGIFYFLLVGLSMIGIGLGIAGIFAKEGKRGFALWGLALSAGMLLISFGIFMPPIIFFVIAVFFVFVIIFLHSRHSNS
jgi:hypothetical protein